MTFSFFFSLNHIFLLWKKSKGREFYIICWLWQRFRFSEFWSFWVVYVSFIFHSKLFFSFWFVREESLISGAGISTTISFYKHLFFSTLKNENGLVLNDFFYWFWKNTTTTTMIYELTRSRIQICPYFYVQNLVFFSTYNVFNIWIIIGEQMKVYYCRTRLLKQRQVRYAYYNSGQKCV